MCDRGLTLGNLIGMLREFFKRMGMPELRFKPAYNPYTEPSMEIFGSALSWASFPPQASCWSVLLPLVRVHCNVTNGVHHI